MANYQNIKIIDLGAGIDQESTENRIPPGFVEDAANADPQPTGQIWKRRGYQGFAGNIPVRVTELNQVGTQLCLTLSDSVDLSDVRSSPVIIRGKQSESLLGDFPADDLTTRYYSGFEIDIRRTFSSGTHADTILQSDHDITSPVIWAGAASSDSLFNNSNTQFILDSLSIDQTSKDVTYGYTSATTFPGFVYLTGRDAVAGQVFNSASTSISPGTATYTILAGTHGLSNQNILVKVFKDLGSSYEELYPDAVVIDSLTGDVDITLTNGAPGFLQAIFSLVSAPTANFMTGNIGGAGTVSVDIDTSGFTPFTFVTCYLKNGSDYEQVIPDSIIHNTTTSTTSVTFTNAAVTGRIFYVYWEFASIITNQLCVTAVNSATITDLIPQLTIFGLDHSEIYGATRGGREGWTSHIDTYRSIGENRVVAGLGGNFFTAQMSDEVDSSYLMPTAVYPRINAALSPGLVIGPAFYDTADTPSRTRGYISGTAGGNNTFTVTSVTYDSTWVKYVLSVPGLVVSGSLPVILSTTAGMEDRLTTSQCGWSVHNGEFPIKQVTTGVDVVNIWVENTAVDSSDFDELNAGGFAGVFSDRLTFSGSTIPPFIPNDLLLSGLFSEIEDLRVVNSQVLTAVPTTLITNVVSEIELPTALRVTARRTSSILPLRTLLNVADVTNLVRGDMLSYSEVERLLRVKSINPNADITITDIDGDGDFATVTISGSTSSFAVGQKLLFLGTSEYNGIQTITSLLSTTTFQISTTSTAVNNSGTIIGKTVELDEELTYEDTELSSTYFAVHSRFIPVEHPEDTYDLTPKTKIRYLDADGYGEQEIVRSGMVQDNLYMTNGQDEVYKFDGLNMYRAGLFRWQPHVFIGRDNTTTGKVDIDTQTSDYSSAFQNQYIVPFSNKDMFNAGDTIRDNRSSLFYTVEKVSDNTANGLVFTTRTIDTSGGGGLSITKVALFRYCFRLNAVDANNNIIASAVTGADDTYFRLSVDAGIRIRLVGMPVWDIYDYSRLEVEIYRTKADAAIPIFYKVATIPMSFSEKNAYIDYIDTDSDEDLRTRDPVNVALKGNELGTAWTEPLRAKYVTTADNKLVLGNVRDYPQLDIQLIKKNETLLQADFTNASNNTWLFRRDSTDTQTTNNMVDRASYKFIDVTDGTQTFSITSGNISYNAAAKTFTVLTANTAAAGNWVYLFHNSTHLQSNVQLRFSGWYQIASVSVGVSMTFNANLGTSNITSGATDVTSFLLDSAGAKSIPVPIGSDANFGMVNGNSVFQAYEYFAIRRLADAINASMRAVDVSISGYETFKPWMIAAAGSEIGNGAMTIRQPRVDETSLEVVIPALSGSFDVYVNALARAGGSNAGVITREYPSRILVSYANYPEIFDAPTAVLDIDSDSAIDVNSADGQVITGIIPFFSESAFGAAQKSGVVVVFKTNSIYLVDLAAKDAGQPAIQKLETHGNGCTAPYSIAYSKNGIMFANESGIFRLGTDLRVTPVGDKYGRKWKDNINKDYIDLATGTHDTDTTTYKVSYPVVGEVENSLVAVYNHTREGQTSQFGSWTTYDNHAATGWANLLSDSYFASTTGRVFSLRKLGEDTDYRDDSSAVDFSLTLAASDFGDAGIRKIVKYITTHFRSTADTAGTTLTAAADLSTQFDSTDAFQVNNTPRDTGLSDPGTLKVVSIQSSPKKKKLVYLQLKYENSSVDEPVEIAGIDIYVSGLAPQGITQAYTSTT